VGRLECRLCTLEGKYSDTIALIPKSPERRGIIIMAVTTEELPEGLKNNLPQTTKEGEL